MDKNNPSHAQQAYTRRPKVAQKGCIVGFNSPHPIPNSFAIKAKSPKRSTINAWSEAPSLPFFDSRFDSRADTFKWSSFNTSGQKSPSSSSMTSENKG